jgi:hypothetical protein
MRPRRTNGRTGQTQSRIAGALEQLQEERGVLSARIEKLDTLIAEMQELFHLPSRNATARRSRRAADTARSRRVRRFRGGFDLDALKAALRAGAVSPGVLAKQLGIDRPRLRAELRQLEDDGVIVCTGTTSSRKVALAGKAPAKEAP